MTHLVLAATAAVLALVATPLVRRLAVRVGAVDEPGTRRVHAVAVPRLGGVAILVAGAGALVLGSSLGVPVIETLGARGWRLGWLLAGVLVVVMVGVADDVRGLTPGPKLVFQTAAAAIALAGGYQLTGVTNPFTGGYVELGVLGSLVTLAWILFVTNAINLIDGLDGLAGGVTAIAAATLLGLSFSEGRPDAAYLWATLLGALAGFLPYNWNPASIFLGDSGSLLLGYLLAVLSIQSMQKGATTVIVLVPILALGLPLMETGATVFRRTLESGLASVFRADQEHLHHRLIRLGMTHHGAVLSLYAVCLAFNLLAFLSVVVQGFVQTLLVGAGALVLVAGIRTLRARQRRRAAG